MDMKKKRKLRHSEYYDCQTMFDELYQQSLNNNNFYHLLEKASLKDNICLAYRNIKNNTGSNTEGTDGLTIKNIKHLTTDEVVSKIQSMFEKYEPGKVRRVLIDKPNGDKRPLGIPTIWDRIFQQCILQVLEPICEAKFHNHSYGFRPNRSTHHAIARMNFLINISETLYCVDVDIKGFFDNVNHSKLLKQMWKLGIRDKSMLSIISRLLKAEIDGEGIPSKGTPQGGILSPLLSNIVLNELDWWVSDQWETFETKREYKGQKYRALRKTGMKECYIVRYADDFKILCCDYKTATKMYHAVEDFLKNRLHLQMSTEKSQVINLKRKSSDFLGISIKASKKSNRYVAYSNMSTKSKKKAHRSISDAIKNIQRKQSQKSVWRYNSLVIGIQNYYSVATHVNLDLAELDYVLRKKLFNRLRNNWKDADKSELLDSQQERYKDYDCKYQKVSGIVLVPIYGQKHNTVMNFSQDICNYTIKGRNKVFTELKNIDKETLRYVKNSYISDRSIEYNDNRISKFIGQNGKCSITGLSLGKYGWHCHHKVRRIDDGDDSFNNLTIILDEIHKTIHMTDINKISDILSKYKLNSKQKERFDEFRIKSKQKPIFKVN